MELMGGGGVTMAYFLLFGVDFQWGIPSLLMTYHDAAMKFIMRPYFEIFATTRLYFSHSCGWWFWFCCYSFIFLSTAIKLWSLAYTLVRNPKLAESRSNRNVENNAGSRHEKLTQRESWSTVMSCTDEQEQLVGKTPLYKLPSSSLESTVDTNINQVVFEMNELAENEGAKEKFTSLA